MEDYLTFDHFARVLPFVESGSFQQTNSNLELLIKMGIPEGNQCLV